MSSISLSRLDEADDSVVDDGDEAVDEAAAGTTTCVPSKVGIMILCHLEMEETYVREIAGIPLQNTLSTVDSNFHLRPSILTHEQRIW